MLYTIHIPDIVGNRSYKGKPVFLDVQKDTRVTKSTLKPFNAFSISINTGSLSAAGSHNYIVYDDEFTRDLVYQDLMNNIQSL